MAKRWRDIILDLLEWLLMRLCDLYDWIDGDFDETQHNMSSNVFLHPRCMDCGKKYADFPLDVVLTDEQWTEITGRTDGSGILCAACIVERGAKLSHFTVAKLVFE